MQQQQLLNNRYRVDGLLGNGGMAIVYVGTDTLLRRRVAIKVLRDQYASDDDFVKRFSNEAQSAAKLSHPNIVNVFDFGHENGAYYIVMELVDGSTLGELLREERVLPEGVAVDYAIQIASGLAYAHRQGLLHRDVKPANILVTKDDVVKLGDFGIARVVSENVAGVTQPGMVMGSVAYISPEQAQNHDLDERSDLYALGVVLYQMLTGSLPFSGETPVAVALKHVAEPPPPIDLAATGVSPAVAAIVARLLRKSPGERFSSATELASALREARERPTAVPRNETFAEAPTSRFGAVKPPPRRSVAPDRPSAAAPPAGAVEEPAARSGPDPRWIVMPLLLLLAAALGFVLVRGDLFAPARNIAVLDEHGKSATVAQQELLAQGLRPSVTSEPSETVTEDHVIRQDPAPGTKLAKDAVVTLVVSAGLPMVQVPDVKGYSIDDARRALAAAKLRAKKTNASYSQNAPAGQVTDVNPAVGANVRENSTVALTVSLGAKPILVPSVVNLSVDDARRRLAAAGLKMTVSQSTENDAIPADRIVSQVPDPQSAVTRDSAVSVVVSAGPGIATVPDVVMKDADAAQQALQAAGFIVKLGYDVDGSNATQQVAKQDPAAGEKLKKGSAVQLFISVPGSVPDITGMTIDDAKRTLTAAGYKVGNVAYSVEGNVQPGQVVRSEPEAGMQLTPGESVNITVLQAAQRAP